MSLRGVYMVLKVNEEVIAETTSVNMKIKANPIEYSSQESSNASFLAGKYMIGFAGAFLYSEDFATLYSLKSAGTQVDVTLYIDTEEIMNGFGIIKSLSLGSVKDVTGTYGIRFYVVSMVEEGLHILAESGLEILTEAGEAITVEAEGGYYLLNDLEQIMTDDSYNRVYIDG